MERSVLQIDLEAHLGEAAKELRAAWLLCKHNGMEPAAKELADTVLDVETAHRQVKDDLGLSGLTDVLESLREDNARLWKMIKDSQDASNSAGLIGMVGSKAWVGQIKKALSSAKLTAVPTR